MQRTEIFGWVGAPKEQVVANDTYRTEDILKMYESISLYQSIINNKEKYEIKERFLKNKNEVAYNNVAEQYKKMIDDNGIDMYKYYEYIQFTKAKFKCTEMKYGDSGRVESLKFIFTGEIE